MGKIMDRRQKKTRDLIFKAFIGLLSKKHYNQITVGEIIEHANVGRATFYAHFETKDFLLKNLCEELFGHIFDCTKTQPTHNKYIFDCNAPSSVFLHLYQHLEKNDNNILRLLSCPNNELFLKYFKDCLISLIESQLNIFDDKRNKEIPLNLWINHIAVTFVETIRWWLDNGTKQSPQTMTNYFLALV